MFEALVLFAGQFPTVPKSTTQGLAEKHLSGRKRGRAESLVQPEASGPGSCRITPAEAGTVLVFVEK